MNREAWKVYYRMLRIARREGFKVSLDVMCYGIGYAELNYTTGECRHVPLDEIYDETPTP